MYNPLDKSMIDLHTYVTPTSHISIYLSLILVLHTPLLPITLFLLFAQPFQLSSVPGLDWSPTIHLSSPVHRYFLRSSSVCLNTTTPLLIFSSTLPPPIPFSILPCAHPLNRNESRVQPLIPVPGYLVGNTAPLSSSPIFLSITIASHGIYSSLYTIFERNVQFFSCSFFFFPRSLNLYSNESSVVL